MGNPWGERVADEWVKQQEINAALERDAQREAAERAAAHQEAVQAGAELMLATA
jgi:hypothetical protein